MKSIREMSGKLHEFMIALEKAGFTPADIQCIVNSKDNSLAEKMHKAIYKELQELYNPKKFFLLKDLGVITVPDDYNHAIFLALFTERQRDKISYINPKINDRNFSNPSFVLKPGDKINVRVFKQSSSVITTFAERMSFLATENALLLGAQGTAIVFEQKKDLLLSQLRYLSFDKRGRLYKDSVSRFWIPGLRKGLRDDFGFSIHNLTDGYYPTDVFFCFTEVKQENQQ